MDKKSIFCGLLSLLPFLAKGEAAEESGNRHSIGSKPAFVCG